MCDPVDENPEQPACGRPYRRMPPYACLLARNPSCTNWSPLETAVGIIRGLKRETCPFHSVDVCSALFFLRESESSSRERGRGRQSHADSLLIEGPDSGLSHGSALMTGAEIRSQVFK